MKVALVVLANRLPPERGFGKTQDLSSSHDSLSALDLSLRFESGSRLRGHPVFQQRHDQHQQLYRPHRYWPGGMKSPVRKRGKKRG